MYVSVDKTTFVVKYIGVVFINPRKHLSCIQSDWGNTLVTIIISVNKLRVDITYVNKRCVELNP